jgi:adenylate cyclase class 2
MKAELFHKRALEVDEYFDMGGKLHKTDEVLRLRDRSVLTYKGPQQKKQNMKVREELEVMVADGSRLEQILGKLGYTLSDRKEKYRETYLIGITKVSLDETPMGNYIEIEGKKENIAAVARKLGFRERDYITKSYTALWKEYARKHNVKGPMVFRNVSR